MVGTYHRPVVQEKVIVFLDFNDSTSLAERLGAVQTKSLVGKFPFDISKPITDYAVNRGDGGNKKIRDQPHAPPPKHVQAAADRCARSASCFNARSFGRGEDVFP
jgi:hypothetical protein